jgi:serine/threonine protein kinase
LVGTRQDLCATSHVNETFAKMQEQFSSFGVRNILAVSCLSGKGLKELKSVILELALKQRTMGEQIPRSYLELEALVIRKRQENATSKKPPVLSFEEFRSMVGSLCLLTEEELLRATEFLHELGSLVHFKQPGLSNFVILDPHWLTEVMATVVSSKTSLDRGILHHRFLTSHIWKGEQYPSHLHPVLLLLLEKFQITFRMRRKRPVLRAIADVTGPTPNQLSFKVGDKILLLDKPRVGKWWKGLHNGAIGYFQQNHIRETQEPPEYTYEDESLVPCLLPMEPPVGWETNWPEFEENTTQVGRRWKFDFLPLPFFPQLLVRMLHFAESRLHWRYGLVFERGEIAGLVTVNHTEGFLYASVRGASVDLLSDTLSLIEEQVETLRDWFGVNFAEVTIPCCHCYKQRSVEPYFFKLDMCETAAAQDIRYVACNASANPKGVEVLLSDVVPDIAMANCNKISFGVLQLATLLGEGAYADVYEGIYNGETVAVKRLKNVKGFKEFRTEAKFMSAMNHPNIVALKGVCLSPPCLVTEFMELGSLHSYLANEQNILSWQQCIGIAEDIAQAMLFLHSQTPPKIHRDLKSPNILLTLQGSYIRAKVADFGTARSLAPIIGGRIVDNPIWLAPEIMRNEEYSEKADCYSYGIILYEILTRRFPFGKRTRFQIELDVVAGIRPDLPDDCPPPHRQLIEACWHEDPAFRPPFVNILERLKAPTPLLLQTREDTVVDSLSIQKAELLFPESKPGNDPCTIKTQYRGSMVLLPASFLNNCIVLDFPEYFISKQAARNVDFSSSSLSVTISQTLPSEMLAQKITGLSELKNLAKTDEENNLFEEYGLHRVLGEDALPQLAMRLDNTASIAEDELLLSVEAVCIECSSVRQMEQNYTDVIAGIMDIVPERGKMHNPSTNSGGLLIGTIIQAPPHLHLNNGDRIMPLCCLSSIPLRLDRVSPSPFRHIFHVSGQAIVFPCHSVLKLPSALSPDLALCAFEAAAGLSRVESIVKNSNTTCVVGCGRKGMMALCYLRKVFPTAYIIGFDKSESSLERATTLNVANKLFKVDVTNALELLSLLNDIGIDIDVVLNCISVPQPVFPGILIPREGGTLIFCGCLPSLGQMRASGKDVCVVFGRSVVSSLSLAGAILDLLASCPALVSVLQQGQKFLNE